MLQSFLHKFCKQELLDLSLMVKMSLSNKRDMHDSWGWVRILLRQILKTKYVLREE